MTDRTDDMSLRPRAGESAEDVVERVTAAAKNEAEEFDPADTPATSAEEAEAIQDAALIAEEEEPKREVLIHLNAQVPADSDYGNTLAEDLSAYVMACFTVGHEGSGKFADLDLEVALTEEI